MKSFVKKHLWPFAGAALAAVLALCAWTFGWFGGTIDVMDFTAEEVECIELHHYWLSEERVTVTEKADMQALIDAVNGFRNTGTMLKHPKKLIPGGGELWYGITVYLKNGEIDWLMLSQLNGRTNISNMEMQYGRFGTCRGSMELFYELHEKYSVENPA